MGLLALPRRDREAAAPAQPPASEQRPRLARPGRASRPPPPARPGRPGAGAGERLGQPAVEVGRPARARPACGRPPRPRRGPGAWRAPPGGGGGRPGPGPPACRGGPCRPAPRRRSRAGRPGWSAASAAASAAAPSGLWAPSSSTPPSSLQPARPGGAGQPAGDGRLVRPAAPRASAGPAARPPPARRSPAGAAPGAPPDPSQPRRPPRRARRAAPPRPAAPPAPRAAGRRDHRRDAGLEDAGLLPRHRLDGVAEELGVVEADAGHRRHRRRAPRWWRRAGRPGPTSTTATSTPPAARWRKAGHGGELEVGEPLLRPPASCQGQARRTASTAAASAASSIGAPSTAIRSLKPRQVGRGVEPDPVAGGGAARPRPWRRWSPCRWCRPRGAPGSAAPGGRAPSRARSIRSRPKRMASGCSAVQVGRRTSIVPARAPQPEQRQDLAEPVAQLVARDDGVDHPVLQEELGALEAGRQLLADGLLDDPRAGEADERLRLGQDDVAQPGEGGRHAAGGRVEHDRDVGLAHRAEAVDAPPRSWPSA